MKKLVRVLDVEVAQEDGGLLITRQNLKKRKETIISNVASQIKFVSSSIAKTTSFLVNKFCKIKIVNIK